MFDLVIGNPPWNKGTVRKHHSIYNHSAMNAGRDGTVGFLLNLLPIIADKGILSFVTPVKFLRGPGCFALRTYLFKHYKLVSVKMIDARNFDVCAGRLCINTWINGITTAVNADNVTINPNETPDGIIPAFPSQEIANQYVNDCKHGVLGRPIPGPQPINDNWKVVFRKTFHHKFRLEPPGYALGFYENCYEFDSEEQANQFFKHVEGIRFISEFESILLGRHTHVATRYLPYVRSIFAFRQTDFLMRYLPVLK